MKLDDYNIELTIYAWKSAPAWVDGDEDLRVEKGTKACFAVGLFDDITPTEACLRLRNKKDFILKGDKKTINDYRHRIYENKDLILAIANKITVQDVREAIHALEKDLAYGSRFIFHESMRGKFFVRDLFYNFKHCFEVYLYCERKE